MSVRVEALSLVLLLASARASAAGPASQPTSSPAAAQPTSGPAEPASQPTSRPTSSPAPLRLPGAPAPCRPRVRFMFPGKRCDVQIAVNADMGYGAVLASGAGADGALFMGLQLAATWKALFWSAVELQMAFSSYEAPGQGTGILSPVLFIGSRPGFALRLGAEGRHHIVLSTGLGWGEVYHREVNQEHAADGLVVSPALRYTYGGIFGLEVQAFLPAYPGIVGPYPAAITVNVLGLPLAILVAFAQAMH